MYVARLICSDEGCAEVSELEAGSLAELALLACECGCVLDVIGWADWVEPGAVPVVVALRAGRMELREAA